MKRKHVLVTPLDWGLGHATRCVPIIRLLLELECKVFLGGSGPSLQLLCTEFPALSCINLPAYDPVYPPDVSMAWTMLAQLSKFRKAIQDEHDMVEHFVSVNQIDYVISDNRYGCWSSSVYCVFITHQTNIKMPSGLRWFGGLINCFNHRQIKKFNQCWIPDFSDHTFSGELSSTLRMKSRFIGPLSRFSRSLAVTKKYDLLILLSGPEPQRSIFEELLLAQLAQTSANVLMIRGVSNNFTGEVATQIEIINFCNTTELQNAIEQSELVISRPGYSTIMDLARLGKKAIFIPTPGQTEQEYLAAQLKVSGIAYCTTQKDFDLHQALHCSEKYSGFKELDFNEKQLSSAIQELFNF